MTRADLRWPFTRGPIRILLAAALALVPSAAAGARPPGSPEEFDRPAASWRTGPVRYLLTKEEDDAFRALATDAERAAFIQRFWVRRDPRPDTIENEYRTLFYKRVADANRLFIESPTGGWKTDRGKIYILLGPPDEQERLDEPQSAREMILWTYRNVPAGVGLGSRSAIRFIKDSSGEFRLSDNIFIGGGETSLGVGLQVQAMQMKSLPEPRQVLDTIVNNRSFLDSAPFRTHRDFFRSADGNTFAVVTVGLKQSLIAHTDPGAEKRPATSDGRFEVLVRLAGEDPGLPTYDLVGPNGLRAAREDATVGPEGYLLYQGGVTVKPGRYTAYCGVVDRATDQVYSFKESIAVPDLKSDTLELSSVTLASSLERVAEGSKPGYSIPFVLGNLRVLPRPDDQFHNGETFAFYYQIYGPANDPIDGHPDLDIEYQFLVARSAGPNVEPTFEPLGKPIRLTHQQSQVQGYSFPLKDWPAASYRLRVLITDNLSGRQSSREVTFRVL